MAMKTEGITVKYHPPFAFINISQRRRINYIHPNFTLLYTTVFVFTTFCPFFFFSF